MPTKDKTTNGRGNGRASSHNGHAGEESFLERLTRLESQMSFVATKDELAAAKGELNASIERLRAETKEAIAKLRGEMNAHVERLRADNERLRANVEQGFNRMTRWIVGLLGTLVVSFIGLMFAIILRLF